MLILQIHSKRKTWSLEHSDISYTVIYYGDDAI